MFAFLSRLLILFILLLSQRYPPPAVKIENHRTARNAIWLFHLFVLGASFNSFMCASFFLFSLLARLVGRNLLLLVHYSNATLVHLPLGIYIPFWTHSLNRICIFGVCSQSNLCSIATSMVLLLLCVGICMIWAVRMLYGFGSLSSTLPVWLRFSLMQNTMHRLDVDVDALHIHCTFNAL